MCAFAVVFATEPSTVAFVCFKITFFSVVNSILASKCNACAQNHRNCGNDFFILSPVFARQNCHRNDGRAIENIGDFLSFKVLPIYSAASTFYNSDWNTWYDYDWNGLKQLVFCRRGYLQIQSIMLLCPQIQMAHAWISIPDFKNHPRTAVAVWGVWILFITVFFVHFGLFIATAVVRI